MDMTYTPAGQLATETRYSNLAGTQLWALPPTLMTQRAGFDLVQEDGSDSILEDYVYTDDAVGNVTSETLNGGTPTIYTYDATNQLISDSTTTYSYDANGNRTMPGYVTGPDNGDIKRWHLDLHVRRGRNIVEKSMGECDNVDLHLRQPQSYGSAEETRRPAARSLNR